MGNGEEMEDEEMEDDGRTEVVEVSQRVRGWYCEEA